MMSKKLVVIEDDQDITRLVTHYLTKEGYAIKSSQDGIKGLQLIKQEKPDLVILDLMLPEMDGLEVCKRLRADPKTSALPIIVLTAKGEESDKIVGLELGADDYVTKPFSPKELLARVKALFRRSERQVEESTHHRYGQISLDVARHEVRVKDEEIKLTAKEFSLLVQLLKNKGRVMTREVLLDKVWGYDSDVTTRTVDVHIRRLREKIPLLSEAIVTVKSYGYKLKDEDTDSED
ncbi:MAG: response regulator transcription factor [Nitrospira sp.]|nr:response regulator transcription factor [Nitrospira sp.]